MHLNFFIAFVYISHFKRRRAHLVFNINSMREALLVITGCRTALRGLRRIAL